MRSSLIDHLPSPSSKQGQQPRGMVCSPSTKSPPYHTRFSIAEFPQAMDQHQKLSSRGAGESMVWYYPSLPMSWKPFAFSSSATTNHFFVQVTTRSWWRSLEKLLYGQACWAPGQIALLLCVNDHAPNHVSKHHEQQPLYRRRWF